MNTLIDVLHTNYGENYTMVFDKAKMTVYINAEAQKLLNQLNAAKTNMAKVNYVLAAKKDARSVVALLADKASAAVKKAQADIAKVTAPEVKSIEWQTLEKQVVQAYKALDRRNIISTGQLKASEISLMRDANLALFNFLNKKPLNEVAKITQDLSKLFSMTLDVLQKIIEANKAGRAHDIIDTTIVDPFVVQYQSSLNAIEQDMSTNAVLVWAKSNPDQGDALELLKAEVAAFSKAVKDDFDSLAAVE